MLYKQFYSELGKLLYAAADVDGVITKAEKKKIQEIVKEILAPDENQTDEFGSNLAYYSEIEFDFLKDSKFNAASAFESFIDFVEDNKTAITEKMKIVCIVVAKEIASAYEGTNKTEKRFLKELQRRLDNIMPETVA